MTTPSTEPEYRADRESGPIRYQATVFFIVTIAAVGAIMMTLTSSPTAKGASFLWIPAALQLMAGVWLGPWLGMIAGGLGAYLAGILAYGGWGLVDIIMNPIAGGFANSFLPAVLFTLFRIDPTFGTKAIGHQMDILRAAGRLATLLGIVIIVAFAVKSLDLSHWGYGISLLILLFAPFALKGLKLSISHFIAGFLICVFISGISALIGVSGQVVGGQTWQAAFIGVGVGWFLGDTVSAVIGLYVLAEFTERAREIGITKT